MKSYNSLCEGRRVRGRYVRMARSALHNLEKEPFIKLEPLVIIGTPFRHIRYCYLPAICHSALSGGVAP